MEFDEIESIAVCFCSSARKCVFVGFIDLWAHKKSLVVRQHRQGIDILAGCPKFNKLCFEIEHGALNLGAARFNSRAIDIDA